MQTKTQTWMQTDKTVHKRENEHISIEDIHVDCVSEVDGDFLCAEKLRSRQDKLTAQTKTHKSITCQRRAELEDDWYSFSLFSPVCLIPLSTQNLFGFPLSLHCKTNCRNPGRVKKRDIGGGVRHYNEPIRRGTFSFLDSRRLKWCTHKNGQKNAQSIFINVCTHNSFIPSMYYFVKCMWGWKTKRKREKGGAA